MSDGKNANFHVTASQHLSNAIQSLERLALEVDPDEAIISGLDGEAAWLSAELRDIRQRLRDARLRMHSPRLLPPVPAVPSHLEGIGSIFKKQRNGDLKIRPDATIPELCTSIRLLNHVKMSLLGRRPSLSEPPDTADVPEGVLSGWRQMFASPLADIVKGGLAKSLLDWHAELLAECDRAEELEAAGCSEENKNPKDAAAARRALLSSQSAADEAALADWRWTEILAPLMPPKSAPDSAPAVDFKSALVFAGLPADLLPSSLSTGSWRLELAACAGSRMYGLSTPQSDVDYLLVYSRRDEFRHLRHPPDTTESRGPDKTIEFGCCEAAEFARQLLRGSIVQLELLFAQPAARLFVSPAFDWLLQRRMRLATENFIRQLLGLASQLVRTLSKAEVNPDQFPPAEARKVGKAAYQLEHKLNLLTDLAAGIEPRVTLEGAERERVLALRSADWADPASRRALARASLDRHRAVKQTLASRSSRLAENCPTDFLTDWLQVVHFGSHISEAES
ncbi:hypothetical protein BOX15_Mlig000355g4 [Macrostomum lignano]|uniref:Uncharacterized protein n=1 Tax=Macrostomum lignano TaxID=282301 RepID=A0A267DKT4_9PLAT|nr:hypothetical protein BOX15_Mlig000355g4 [Macrostomum lignano]